MIYLILGTNLGDREWNLDRARAMVAQTFHCDLLCSDILETEAVGFDGPPFLNQVIAFQGDMNPEALLDSCQEIERQMGRPPHKEEYDREGRRIYHNRIIDIDILMFNDMTVKTERLEIPHPQLWERKYVKEVLKSI